MPQRRKHVRATGRGSGGRHALAAVLLLLLGAGVAGAAAAQPGGGTGGSAAASESEKPNGFALDGLRVPRKEIVAGGPPRDGIRSIDAPRFVPRGAAGWVNDRDPVIGVVGASTALAFPVHVLERHQVVNAELEGAPIVVTYDPLAGSPLAWRRELDGRTLEFGVSGLLHNGNFLLYDRETESLWVQFTGKAVAGPLAGRRLQRTRVHQEPLASWMGRHRGSRVLAPPEPEPDARPLDYSQSPYRRYWIQNRIPFPVRARDPRFHAKELVVGVEAGGVKRAYLGSLVTAAGGRVEDRIGEHAIRIDYDSEAGAYRFAIPPDVQVTEAYWFAWKAFHPDTEVWRDPGDVAPLDQD